MALVNWVLASEGYRLSLDEQLFLLLAQLTGLAAGGLQMMAVFVLLQQDHPAALSPFIIDLVPFQIEKDHSSRPATRIL
jgi:hypothetical protein